MKMRFQRLQTFLAAVVAATAIGLIVVIGSLVYWWQSSRSEAESTRMVSSLMATVKDSAAVAAFARNPEIGRDVVNGLLQNDVVFRARIVAGEQAIAEAERRAKGGTLAPVVVAITSPFDNKEKVGELIVEPDAEWVAGRARDSALAMVVWMTALILLTAAVSTIVIRKLLSKPLVEVVAQLQKVVPGTPARLLVAWHLEKNEVGVLISGFNHLMDKMAASFEIERELRARVERVQGRLQHIFNSTPAGILSVDAAGRLMGANPAMAALIGFSEESLRAQIGDPVLEQIFAEPEAVWKLVGEAAATRQPAAGDFALHHDLRAGARWVHGQFSVTLAGGEPETIDGVFYDITERKLAEDAAVHDALHDHLTGLLNRRGSEVWTDRLLREAIGENCRLALMMIDLDGFKGINDMHGHDAGDLVLVQTAKRLAEGIRSRGDIAARLGGDEFLIILYDCSSNENVSRVAQKLIEALSYPIALASGVSVHVGASIGIACYPDLGKTRDDLAAAADGAMYAVKRRGKNGYSIATIAPTASEARPDEGQR